MAGDDGGHCDHLREAHAKPKDKSNLVTVSRPRPSASSSRPREKAMVSQLGPELWVLPTLLGCEAGSIHPSASRPSLREHPLSSVYTFRYTFLCLSRHPFPPFRLPLELDLFGKTRRNSRSGFMSVSC